MDSLTLTKSRLPTSRRVGMFRTACWTGLSVLMLRVEKYHEGRLSQALKRKFKLMVIIRIATSGSLSSSKASATPRPT